MLTETSKTMTTEKHTPGPWQLSKSGEVIFSGAVSVANTHGHDNAEANAKLIAASPELLEAAKQFVWNWENDIWTDADIEQAKAAIKKATE